MKWLTGSSSSSFPRPGIPEEVDAPLWPKNGGKPELTPEKLWLVPGCWSWVREGLFPPNLCWSFFHWPWFPYWWEKFPVPGGGLEYVGFNWFGCDDEGGGNPNCCWLFCSWSSIRCFRRFSRRCFNFSRKAFIFSTWFATNSWKHKLKMYIVIKSEGKKGEIPV